MTIRGTLITSSFSREDVAISQPIFKACTVNLAQTKLIPVKAANFTSVRGASTFIVI